MMVFLSEDYTYHAYAKLGYGIFSRVTSYEYYANGNASFCRRAVLWFHKRGEYLE